MHWITASLLMFVCSVVLYLVVRYTARHKISLQFNNLASFAPEAFIFSAAAIASKESFAVTPTQFGLLVLTAFFLSFLSNRMSLKSIELAPNPGYSLIISKSYVVMTTFLAVPLFGAHLSAQSLLAILIIVGFSMLIMLNPKASHRTKSSSWVLLALGAFFGWGFLSLVAKYFFSLGMTPLVFLAYLSIIVSLCVLIEMRIKHVSFRPIINYWQGFVLIGLAATGFNYFHFTAISLAPNVGYVSATNAASISAVTICAILLFKDDFSWRKLAGVFGVTAGLLTLFLA